MTVLIIVIAVLLLLALGGYVANRRREAASRTEFEARLDAANRHLAAAHAADKGWEPAGLEAAARAAYAQQRPGVEPAEVVLYAVVDPPGTEDDKAVFAFTGPDAGRELLTLGRRGDGWHFESLTAG